jgi:hypothetical protein
MAKRYEVTRRQARRQLEHKERLRASQAKTYEAARRWHQACQATGAVGGGEKEQPALGEVIQNLLTVPEGQKNLVRWHNGVMTTTWFPTTAVEVGVWVVAATVWNDPEEQLWLSERVLRVTRLVDRITKVDLRRYEDYWRFTRELDELEMATLLMIAPAPTPTVISPLSAVTVDVPRSLEGLDLDVS